MSATNTDKSSEDSGVDYQAAFDWTIKDALIPVLKTIANEIGEEDFIGMLKRAGSKLGCQMGKNLAQTLGKNDIASYAAFVKENHLFNTALTFETVEETDGALEVSVSECLWARTCREADASDIGYAVFCHGDYDQITGFNPGMKMVRTKTLMQGDGCCNHRWVMET